MTQFSTALATAGCICQGTAFETLVQFFSITIVFWSHNTPNAAAINKESLNMICRI